MTCFSIYFATASFSLLSIMRFAALSISGLAFDTLISNRIIIIYIALKLFAFFSVLINLMHFTINIQRCKTTGADYWKQFFQFFCCTDWKKIGLRLLISFYIVGEISSKNPSILTINPYVIPW